MARPRAETFAERLEPVVPKEEADISALSDDMADVLYPGRRPRPFRMGVSFDRWAGEGYERAVALARRSEAYRETSELGNTVHHAEFTVEEAAALRDLFALVGARPGTEVTFDRKRVPYARELWLPLFWVFVKEPE
ncbi:MAG TPA: hypothetical protein VII13_06245 [Vicinamibacteria bacterium]